MEYATKNCKNAENAFDAHARYYHRTLIHGFFGGLLNVIKATPLKSKKKRFKGAMMVPRMHM